MGRGRGVLAAGACAAALIVAPGAHASQGSDQITRGDHISYVADPGEANRLIVEDWSSGGLHLNDASYACIGALVADQIADQVPQKVAR